MGYPRSDERVVFVQGPHEPRSPSEGLWPTLRGEMVPWTEAQRFSLGPMVQSNNDPV
jgi:hypothetical protein